jgi:FkbM family methyltransferase
MLFLHAFFHLYAALIQSLRSLFWKILIILQSNFCIIRPYPHFKFKVKLKGFVTYLVFINQPLRYFRKSFEYKVFKFIHQHLKPGDIAVDVGANVGLITLFMSEIVGNAGRIYAIEASYKNAKTLKENLFLNNKQNVHIINHAVSDKEMMVYMKSPITGYNDALLIMDDKESLNSEPVRALSFDEIVKQWEILNVKLIKIDIEGAEIFFFKGAINYFRFNKPILIFETLETYCQRFNHSVIDVLVLIRAFGYHIEQLDIETWVAWPIQPTKSD